MATYNGRPIAFEPTKGSQVIALQSPYNEILYYGTRGNGKTNVQIVKFLQSVGVGFGEYWKGLILDQENESLKDMVSQAKALFGTIRGVEFNKTEKLFTFPTGETLRFGFGKTIDDYNTKFHGHQYPFIGFNELGNRPDSSFYEAILSCNRMVFNRELHRRKDGTLPPPIPLIVFNTSNPWGRGADWVEARFITPSPIGKPQIVVTQVPLTDLDENGDMQYEEVTLTRVAYFGSWIENHHLPAKYKAELIALKKTDPDRFMAWTQGKFGANIGTMYGKVFNKTHHVMPSFTIPKDWRVDRSHDWGESSPFSNLWFAEANGEDAILDNGDTFCPAKGSLICIAEYFGGTEAKPDVGVNISATNVAKVVKWVDGQLEGKDALPLAMFGQMDVGRIHIVPSIVANTKVKAGAADNAIGNAVNEAQSIASLMEFQGVKWLPSDKSPGSRIRGCSVLRNMLNASTEFKESGLNEAPQIYFMEHCTGIISRLPKLPRDKKNPDDIDTTCGDHDFDALRYRALQSTPKVTKKPRRINAGAGWSK